MRKMNKERFLKTEFGAELKNCVECWDYYLELKDTVNARIMQAQWEVYQLAVREFYGIEYHFTRTDDCFGVVTADGSDWLFRVLRRIPS